MTKNAPADTIQQDYEMPLYEPQCLGCEKMNT